MQIIYLHAFSKDIDKLTNRNISKKLIKVLSELKNANHIHDINNLEKLKGYKNSYRIRINEYRMGMFITGNTIELARFLHRKEIYRKFP